MSPVRFKSGGGTGGGTATVVLGPDFGTAADLDDAAQFTLYSQAQSAQLAAAEAASHAEKQTMLLAQARTIAMPAVRQTMAMLTRQGDITLLQYTTSPLLASKDSWCDVIAGCAVDNNHNATDLQLEGILASKKDIIVGWDLSGFPAGATVTAATVTLGLKTPPTISQNARWGTILAAAEGWSEATVRCSTIPATDNSSATDTVGVGTGAGPRDISWSCVSAGRLAASARMGVGSFSMRLFGSDSSSILSNCVFESKDEGTNNALGPRLILTFTVPA